MVCEQIASRSMSLMMASAGLVNPLQRHVTAINKPFTSLITGIVASAAPSLRNFSSRIDIDITSRHATAVASSFRRGAVGILNPRRILGSRRIKPSLALAGASVLLTLPTRLNYRSSFSRSKSGTSSLTNLFGHGRRGAALHICNSGPAAGMNSGSGGGGPSREVDTAGKKVLVGIAVTYMALIVVFPFLNVFVEAFKSGPSPFFETLTDPDFLQAVKMTLLLSAVAVPINTVFGICTAILLARNDFSAKPFVISLLDLPFSISPVVTGMMLVLLYGRKGLFAPLIAQYGFPIVFAFPGMALATLFVTMPFVVRELLPILEAMDLAEEEAARSLGASPIQTFWNVTLPNIRWGLLYGIILTNARAMGEFGAVSVISGNIIGQTQTLTLFVESSYKEYNSEAAFAAAVLLSLLALVTLIIKEQVESAAAGEHRSK